MMSFQIDWRDAAKADLLARLDAARGTVELSRQREAEARREREEAEREMQRVREAAETLSIDLGAPEAGDRAMIDADAATAALSARDIILDALRAAAPQPMRSADLRKLVEEGLGRSVHYKTTGMTLYRLSKEGLVRRKGQSWFAEEGGQPREDQQREEAPTDNTLI